MPTEPPAPHSLAYHQALGHDMADKRMEILRQIGASGSISEAARLVGVSYKAAWQALDTLGNLAGVALVDRAVGGSGGGGAQLTEAGHALLGLHERLVQARAQVLAQWCGGDLAPWPQTAAHLSLRTSMRNQWPCRVNALHEDGPWVRVDLQGLAPGPLWQSRITQESAQLLALCPGRAVLALCKATALHIYPGPCPAHSAALPNARSGQVRHVTEGAQGDEVSVQLDGGMPLVGMAPAGSGLQVGDTAWLAPEPTALVIVVAA